MEVLSGLQWEVCLLYLDEIIVHGIEFGETIKRLCTVSHAMQVSNWAPRSAFSFEQQSVPFLGHVMSNHSVSTMYWPQEDRGCTYLALSTDSTGCQKLPGSPVLLQRINKIGIVTCLFRWWLIIVLFMKLPPLLHVSWCSGARSTFPSNFSLDNSSHKVVTRTKLNMSNICKPDWIGFMMLGSEKHKQY